MELKLCLIGFGNAAKAFCRLLNENKENIERDHGYRILIVAVAGRSKGSLLEPGGIDIDPMLAAIETCGKLSCGPARLTDMDTTTLIKASQADVLLELSTLSVFDGQPAIGHIEQGFLSGMHVITANKGPIAWNYADLSRMAADHEKEFLFETVVMDGTPVFNLVRETLPGCRVLGFKGILNSTTNFILEEMESGCSFETALSEAKRRGFAEADPSLDIDGWDAAAKTAAIANVLMGGDIKPIEIARQGIGAITPGEIAAARNQNKKIKLVCEAKLSAGMIKASVAPSLIDIKDVYSNIDATSSIITITTDLMGVISIIEQNPEIEQTAYGIYSDLLTLIARLRKKV